MAARLVRITLNGDARWRWAANSVPPRALLPNTAPVTDAGSIGREPLFARALRAFSDQHAIPERILSRLPVPAFLEVTPEEARADARQVHVLRAVAYSRDDDLSRETAAVRLWTATLGLVLERTATCYRIELPDEDMAALSRAESPDAPALDAGDFLSAVLERIPGVEDVAYGGGLGAAVRLMIDAGADTPRLHAELARTVGRHLADCRDAAASLEAPAPSRPRA